MYKIGEVAEKTGISVHTLRYYEKEGLLRFVERSKSGIRLFKESDIELISLIACLKGTGMSIKDIQGFMAYYAEGDATIGKRLALFVEHRKQLEEKIAAMQAFMKKIDQKIAWYTRALEGGTASGDHAACDSKPR